MNDWCQGFCRTCGTGCGQYCEQIKELQSELAAERTKVTDLTKVLADMVETLPKERGEG